LLVTVLLFASARVQAGSPTLVVELAEPANVADLKQALVRACPKLVGLMACSRIAVDAVYADDDDPVRPDAEVALIPPVSGGAFP